MPLYPNRVDTVGDLIAALSDYDPDIPIRWAAQPRWAMAYTIGPVVCTPDDAEGGDGNHDNSLGDNANSHTAGGADDESDGDGPVVWLGEGRQIGYLPGVAASALGWS
jgi:hypothetical protein